MLSVFQGAILKSKTVTDDKQRLLQIRMSQGLEPESEEDSDEYKSVNIEDDDDDADEVPEVRTEE